MFKIFLFLNYFQLFFSVFIEDIYVPLDCLNHASPSDHLLIEFTVQTKSNQIVRPEYRKPGTLFHILLDQSDNPVNRALKGMCENGTRILHFDNSLDVNLSPLPISKYAFSDSEEPFTVEIVLNHITSQSDYQIFNAYKMGNISEIFDMIESHKGINAVDEWGQTLLMLATQKGDLQTVALLLNTRMPKVDVNKAKSNGYTAVFYAVQQPSTAILKALLRRGANPNTVLTQKDSEGSTPLHFACMLEMIKHVELLIEYGADVTIQNAAGQYPLQLLPSNAVRSTKVYLKRLFEEAASKKEANEKLRLEKSRSDL
mmetsp:Transcript_8885/g.9398  ORF Transcript_8885/g.9398 Transcript_8885/m.9398 type:complete len:314 (+) Transcript_8885:47-988(+)